MKTMIDTKNTIREEVLKVVLSLFLLLSFFTPVSSILAADPSSFKRGCNEALLTLKPRLGLPSSNGDNFDVRIVSNWGRESKWSNHELNNAAHENVTSLRAELSQLGFSTRHYINVLVEKHIGAIDSPTQEIGTSLYVGPLTLITTPNFFGGKSFFLGSSKVGDSFENMARTLVLKAMTPDFHSVFSRKIDQ